MQEHGDVLDTQIMFSVSGLLGSAAESSVTLSCINARKKSNQYLIYDGELSEPWGLYAVL